MNLQNFIPLLSVPESESKFGESIESTDESFSREHWLGLISKSIVGAGTKVPLFKKCFWQFSDQNRTLRKNHEAA